MAYNRVTQLDVGAGGTGLRISGLNIDFDIKRSITLDNNAAIFTIYNAKEETRKDVLKEGNNLIFRAGYEDEGNLASIYFGTISKSFSRKVGTEWITDIEAQDLGGNKNPLEYKVEKLSYIAGTELRRIVNDIGTLLSVPVAGIENVTGILNNGFVASGSIGSILRKIKKILLVNDVGIYFDSSEMVIYKVGEQDSFFGVVRITPQNGLIGEIQDITDEDQQDGKKRIGFSSLMNPKLRPSGIVDINTPSLKGTFGIETCSFIGNNYGGEFQVNVEAVE